MTIRIVDVETHKVVRELAGFRGRILDTVSQRLVMESCVSANFILDVFPGL
jgi:hypothetical protein